jgi:hypothetical protein
MPLLLLLLAAAAGAWAATCDPLILLRPLLVHLQLTAGHV